MLLLISSALINAITSYQISHTSQGKAKRFYAIFGVCVNLAILCAFKYSPLFGAMLPAGDFATLLLSIPLPIGISFFTFQGISLVVDVYKNNKIAESTPKNHAKNVVFFIAFFPALIAGPILKAHNFFPQIRAKYLKNIPFLRAFKVLILGYFLKNVIADNLKDQTFWMAYPYFLSYDSASLVVLLIGYSVQIFADFAGYSLIAIGVALLFGYELPKNFNFPYISASFSEFWSRWHISLSSWLKEYLYIPLGGNKKGNLRTYLNLFIVMALGGFWHGAAVSYIIWGCYHGILLILERICSQIFTLPKWRFVRMGRILFVFLAVSFGWLLFCLNDFTHAIAFIQKLFNNEGEFMRVVALCVGIYSSCILIYYLNYLLCQKSGKNILDNNLIWAIMLFLIFTNSGSSDAFIYFQF
ncbi:MBOAT family O-acyltransferase [Helicobacter sp. 23-1045]